MKINFHSMAAYLVTVVSILLIIKSIYNLVIKKNGEWRFMLLVGIILLGVGILKILDLYNFSF